MPRFVEDWRKAWRNRIFRDQFLISLAGLIVALILLRLFLDSVEQRSGGVLSDPVLLLFSPVDFRWITVSLIYSGLLLGSISFALHPFSLILALRAGIVLSLLRAVCLFLLPLDAPQGSIPLVDPLISWPIADSVLTRDLFFAGYTSMMALLALIVRWRDLKIIFACAGAAVSALMVLQHIHYTIDVIAAPCFAYVALGIARQFTVVEVSTTTVT